MEFKTTLGSFVLEAARGTNKTYELPSDQAQEIRDQLSSRISSKVDEIRTSQRKALEESKSVMVF